MPLRAPLLALLATASFLLPRMLHAAGLYIPDLGATALGQGAANIAAPADLGAAYYNPAGLADGAGLRLQLGGRLVSDQVTFQRLDASGANPQQWAQVSNSGRPAIIPSFTAAYNFNETEHPFALAFDARPASGYTGTKLPDPALLFGQYATLDSYAYAQVGRASPQRYSLIDSAPVIFTLALAAAVKVTPWLEVGAALENTLVRIQQRSSIFANDSIGGEGVGYDAILGLDVKSLVNLGGTFGASARLSDEWRLGASYELPLNVKARGTMTLTPSPILAEKLSVTGSGDGTTLELHLPWTARLGLRYVGKLFEAELAGTLEGWHRYEQVLLTPNNISLKLNGVAQPALGTIDVPKGTRNAGSVRLGFVLKPGALDDKWSWLVLRAGLLGETSAVPDEYTAVDQAVWQHLSASLGAGARWGRYEFNLGYAHFFQPDRSISNSRVLQTSGAETNPAVDCTPGNTACNATVIGNGNYSVQLDVVELSLSANFDL